MKKSIRKTNTEMRQCPDCTDGKLKMKREGIVGCDSCNHEHPVGEMNIPAIEMKQCPACVSGKLATTREGVTGCDVCDYERIETKPLPKDPQTCEVCGMIVGKMVYGSHMGKHKRKAERKAQRDHKAKHQPDSLERLAEIKAEAEAKREQEQVAELAAAGEAKTGILLTDGEGIHVKDNTWGKSEEHPDSEIIDPESIEAESIEAEGKGYPCSLCEKSFPTQQGVAGHMASHAAHQDELLTQLDTTERLIRAKIIRSRGDIKARYVNVRMYVLQAIDALIG